MRLPITCMKCFQEDGRPPDEAISVELRDDGLYVVSLRFRDGGIPSPSGESLSAIGAPHGSTL
jgi:hypothetical protein